MATVALGVAGFAIGGPIGGMAGAAVGSVIDSAVLNAISAPIRQGKLDDLRGTGVDQGGPAAWVSGPRCRVAGQVIWQSNLREVQHSSGGGPFSGPRIINYSYFRDVAIALTRRQCES